MNNKGYIYALLRKNGLSSTNGENQTINLGVNNSNISLAGTNTVLNAVDTKIKDKLITLNINSTSSSGFNAGIEIEENSSITAYLKVNEDRDEWLIKAPTTNEASIFTTAGGTITGPVTCLSTMNISGNTTINSTLNANQINQQGYLLVPTGTIICYAGSSSPTGYLLCNGTAINRSTYNTLFLIIGTTYGIGDGVNTFNLPNLCGRVPVGAGLGAGLTNRVLSNTGGEETHTLTVSEMPSHNHGGSTSINGSHVHNFTMAKDDGNSSNNVGQYPAGDATPGVDDTVSYYVPTESAGDHSHTINSQGGGAAHNVMQPFIVLNYLIKY